MKYIVGAILLVLVQTSNAKTTFPKDCSHLENVAKSDFVLFSKKEFIQLGECLAVSLIKKHSAVNLVESCNEVDEDRRNPLGILSLSKYEAILIGQCVGAINYIYQRYDNEPVYNRPNSNSQKVYHCAKSKKAIDIIRLNKQPMLDKTDLKKLLCSEGY